MKKIDLVIQIEELKKRHNTIQDILDACPYDYTRNLDLKLTSDLFYEKLFYTNHELDSKQRRLWNKFSTIEETKRIIFFTGYSGSGKTTFIKDFQKNYKSKFTEFKYIDFASLYGNMQRGINPISYTLANYIVERRFEEDNVKYMIDFLSDLNATPSLLIYFSKETKQALSNYITRGEPYKLEDFIYNLTSKEIVNLFLLMCINKYIKNGENKKFIICFDNLDRTGIEYLSEKFLNEFIEVYDNAIRISQNCYGGQVSFTADFYFIMCMREVSYSLLEIHSIPRIMNMSDQEYFEPLTDTFYRNIVGNRIKFIINDLQGLGNPEVANRILKRFNQAITSQDFRKIFLPLFNYDYRKLVNIIREISTKKDLTGWPFNLESDQVSEISKCAFIGTWLNYIAKELHHRDFLLKKIRERIPPKDGFCLPERALLIYLLNKQVFEGGNLENLAILPSCDLLNIINGFEGIYQREEILKTLVRLFLAHAGVWSNLITISYKYLRHPEIFSTENEWETIVNKIKNVLGIGLNISSNPIKVSINPAGFIFVYNLLIHFEYCSSMLSEREKISNIPLFKVYLNEFIDTNQKRHYSFERIIDKVFDMVKYHNRLMLMFYESKYKPKLSNIDYCETDYAFKNESNNYTRVRVGSLHSTRVIFSHIEYIEKFRQYIIEKFKNEKPDILETEKWCNINQLIIDRIQAYLDLLIIEYDLEAKRKKMLYIEKMKQIVESKFHDYKIRIEIDTLPIS